MITAGDIKVSSRFPIAGLADLEMEVKEGNHGKVVLRGYLSAGEKEAGPTTGDDISITLGDKDGRKEILFCGTIQEAYIFHENGVRQAILTAVSASAKMDRRKRSRSFQDVSVPCTKIIRGILSEYGGEMAFEDAPVKTGKPVVQYEETDWEFCRRLAGRMGWGMFACPSRPEPVLEVGLVEGRKAFFPEDGYRCCVDREYYSRGRQIGASRAEFLYYQVVSEENYEIGDSARYKGQKRYIFEKRAELKDGTLQFWYKLGGKCRFMGEEQPNRKIAGASLRGEVERTEGENVYLRLDIDGSSGRAVYPYPWAPAPGSLVYCMPQPGTKAWLYFPDCDEGSAEAVSSIRTGSQCPEFGDAQRRTLATEHGKQLRMYADGIYFQNDRGKAGQRFMLGLRSLALEAGTGRLAVTGKEGVAFRAPFVRIATPLEISQYKMERYAAQKEAEIRPKGSRNPATGGDAGFSMQYEFNGLAERGILVGSGYERYLPFDDEPAYEKDCATWLKVLAGFAVAAVVGILVGAVVGALVVCCAPLAAVVAAAGVTALQAGVIAGVITAGAGIAAAAATCVHDGKNGTASSLGDYVYNSFTASVHVGGAIVAVCMSYAAAEVVTIMATGGMPMIPGITAPITALEIWRTSRVVFLGFTISNFNYQLQDVRDFVIEGKPLGEPTGKKRYDTEKGFVEAVANMVLYLGAQDPYIYMKPTISPLPDNGSATNLPQLEGAVMSGQGYAIQPVPLEVVGGSDEIIYSWNKKDIEAFNKLTFGEKQVYLKAVSREQEITEMLKQIVLEQGGYLEGIGYRIKSPSSVYEKIYLRPESTPISEMNDIVRYTEIQDPEHLVNCVEETLKSLENEGYKVLKLKNTWLDPFNPYNGINTQILAPNGQIFELQFHTPESYELKNGVLHELYEQRRCTDDADHIMELNEKMFDLSDELEKPIGIERIENIP